MPVYIAGHMRGPSMLDLCKGRGMLENCPPVHTYVPVNESPPKAFGDLNYRPLGRQESRFDPLANLQHMLCVAVVLHGLWQGLDVSISPIDLDLELYDISYLNVAWRRRRVTHL